MTKQMRMYVAALTLAWGLAASVLAQGYVRPHSEVSPKPTTDVAVATGAYEADWESLKQWECPEWFKDAKFGIWAHWGPQCQAEDGDWYGRFMYYDGSGQYNWHVSHYGNPAQYGLKELCRDWTAPQWDPEALVKLYYEVGARYFFTLGQHHDNFDLWNSPYQEWNSVNVGPGKDVVGGWAEACKKYGLPLGVSMHGSHAWTWLEGSQDYDGNLTAAEGAGQWWEGYDPQELYAQRHSHSTGWESSGTIHSQWGWGNGAALPDAAYKMKFQNRVLQCINDYQPDMLYFDDTVLPFYGCDESVGLNILSHYYNTRARETGAADVVVMGKILEDSHKQAMLWDVERGVPDRTQDLYWQTCTCIGSWHYDINVYNNNGYKSAQQVVDMLIDVVSKNGNMLLSVPIRANGTIDDKERAVLAGIKEWMDVNSESIYGTRPWKTFGEGPLADAANPLNAQGFNESNNYSAADVRYVQKDGVVYATIMRWPAAGTFTFESLGIASKYYSGTVKSVKLLGAGDVEFKNDVDGLIVNVPAEHPAPIAPVYAITFDSEEVEPLSLAEVIDLYEAKVAELRPQASVNTGKLNRNALNDFAQLVQEAKASLNADENTQLRAIRSLHQAYADLKENGYNKGGAPAEGVSEDLTTYYLSESSNFSATNMGTRFGTPTYWTVENFNLAQKNESKGVKNGIDNYEGHNSLMLGVWSGEDATPTTDLSQACIYQTVHLDAGRYYFGATYNTTYSMSDEAYIFAASAVLPTGEIPAQSIAFDRINQAKSDGTYRGITFTLTEEQDVVLGFQANLLNGSGTQEFRVDNVMLISYGVVDFNALDQLVATVYDELAEAIINDNTGYYRRAAAEELRAQMEATFELDASSTAEEIQQAYDLLFAAYNDFLENGRNQGGTPVGSGYEDWTIEKLHEADHFARTDDTQESGRFGAPKYWTVENFGFGSEAGIDGITGYDCLHLEVWWNQNAYTNAGYDIHNVRLYQKATLPAGRYFFGASYPSAEANDDLYIFASEQLVTTDQISTQTIAFEKVNKAPADGTFRGLFFTLEKETEVYLGWQTDFSKVQTNNLRASGVKLLYYGEINAAKVQALIQNIDEELPTLIINNNTGHYSQAKVDELLATIEPYRSLDETATYDEISLAYNDISALYADFLANAKNPAGEPDDIGATDLTEELLIEASKFSADNMGSRYGTPHNWTVENYNIPSGEGNRNGIDHWPGYNCLCLGIWYDRGSNEGDLSQARIYRTVHLEAGTYYFGATYEANYSLTEAYIFAASALCATSEIPTKSIAYDPIADAGNDNKTYRGLWFTLDEPQDVILGWQADMSTGSDTQEFRVSNVTLLGYDIADAISTPEQNAAARIDFSRPFEVYNLAGQRLNTVSARGMVILRQDGASQKMMLK